MTKNNGLTLVELLITIAILTIIATLALPSFSSTIDNQRLSGAASSLYGDLQLTRSEAIKRNTTITLSATISSGGASWCYAQSDSGPCDCNATGAGSCTINGISSKITKSDDFKGVELASTFTNDSTSFNGIRGGAGSGTYSLSNNGTTYKVVVDSLGFPDIVEP